MPPLRIVAETGAQPEEVNRGPGDSSHMRARCGRISSADRMRPIPLHDSFTPVSVKARPAARRVVPVLSCRRIRTRLLE